MMIRRKTFNMFVQQGVTKQFFEQHINDVTFRCREESPVWFSVQRSKKDGIGTILKAHIHWMLPYEDHSPSPVNKDFPDSWEGFCMACEWLDSKRLEFSEALL